MSRSGAAAVLERGSQAVMRQRLFSGRWLTVMSGDNLRKRMGAVKVGRGSSKGGRERPPKESAERRRVFVIRRVIRRKTITVVIRARCRKMSELVPPKREHEFASPWTVSRRRSAMRASKDERKAIRRESEARRRASKDERTEIHLGK